MNEIERFLEPIPGDSPVGRNLKYSLHDKIKEARRQEDSGPVGLWERDAKTADFKQVIKLSEDALLKSTKDLWITAWLTEAWIYEYDVPGLTSGLQLLQGLIERFWDSLYPELDDGDAEPRATPLEWVGSYFDPSKGSSPI
jgi:type VI secretion system protein ImpA